MGVWVWVWVSMRNSKRMRMKGIESGRKGWI